LAKGTTGQSLTQTSTIPAWGSSVTLGTSVASTSGASIDFTGIPSWVRHITINFSGVSTSGTSVPLIQIGDSGGIEATGYLGSASGVAGSVGSANYTTGCGLANAWSAAYVIHGSVELYLVESSTNTWAILAVLGNSNITQTFLAGSSKATSATLDRVRITTVGGTDTFDAGTINIAYE
jgi:hypothetical protein